MCSYTDIRVVRTHTRRCAYIFVITGVHADVRCALTTCSSALSACNTRATRAAFSVALHAAGPA